MGPQCTPEPQNRDAAARGSPRLPAAPPSPNAKREIPSCREKKGQGRAAGCAAQMAPARGERPGTHRKAAGFNYQLASPGRVQGCAVSRPFFPCPLPRLDLASPPDVFGAVSILAAASQHASRAGRCFPTGMGQIQEVPPSPDTSLCSDQDPQLQLAAPGGPTWSSLCPGQNGDPSI